MIKSRRLDLLSFRTSHASFHSIVHSVAAITGILLTISFLTGCGESSPGGGEVLATVGETTITLEDVHERQQVEQAYSGDSIADYRILAGLVGEALQWEVGRKSNLLPTDEEINRLDSHATATSRAPEVLANVRKVYEGKEERYRRYYLAPRILGDKLHTYQSRNLPVQQERKQMIEAALALVQQGASMIDAASRFGLYRRFDTLATSSETANDEQVAELMNRYGQVPAADPIRVLADTMKPGTLFPQVLEDNQGYRIFRVVNQTSSGPIIETVLSAKKPYDSWFMEEATAIPLSITSASLRDSIQKNYPDLWWTK